MLCVRTQRSVGCRTGMSTRLSLDEDTSRVSVAKRSICPVIGCPGGARLADLDTHRRSRGRQSRMQSGAISLTDGLVA